MEILFRGKSKKTGEWVEGYYAKVTDYLDEETEIHVIFPSDTTLFPHGEFSGFEEVIPETVGQYVGLKDMNGQKVFEGDILESPIKRIDQKYGNLIVIKDVRECRLVALHVAGYTVTANIYDNPELLKGDLLWKSIL